ncbi:universal stress protein [Actinomadura flavalba]|uniref:universal stress protein n=1 Tax=Actinomadura flavalba TaxID=1120938 RepID=UPI0003781044|nr:universal stress protein [Actinomadura flavalba]
MSAPRSKTGRVLVGYSPDDRGEDALTLAAMAARSLGTGLTVAHVHPPGWPARGPGSVDAEWMEYLREQSAELLAEATGKLTALGVAARDVATEAVAHRGSGRGLIEVARATDARLIVAGSAPRGRRGRIAVGSTADQLLHGSPVPVALVPRGYAEDAPRAVERLTVAYWRRRGAVAVPMHETERIATALGVPVRLLTLVLRPSGLPARFRGGAADIVARELEYAARDLEKAAGELDPALDVTTEIAEGTKITGALGHVEMLPGDLLVCQSSHDGPLRKVFVGESSGKIVRNAPCPVVVLPRTSARDSVR